MALFGKQRYRFLTVIILAGCTCSMVYLSLRHPVSMVAPQGNHVFFTSHADESDDVNAELDDIANLLNSKGGKLMVEVLSKLNQLLNNTDPSFTIKLQVISNEAKKEQHSEMSYKDTFRKKTIIRNRTLNGRGELDAFDPVVTGAQRDLLMHLVEKLVTVCNFLNVSYFMYGGTLLGSYRHHDFVPWDDDVDVMIHMKNRNIMYSALATLPGNFQVMSAGPRLKFFSSLSQRTSRYPWKWPYIDISFYSENETHIKDASTDFPYTYAKSIIFPLHDRLLGSLILTSPHDGYATLRAMYKSTKCQTHFYSHKYEMTKKTRAVSVKCDRLRDRVPFVHRSRTESGAVKETLMLNGRILHSIITAEPAYAISKPYSIELL